MSARVPLTRETVLDAAIRLADAEGLGALSMRRLAAELGVEAMSLYNHVANKQDILDGMAALLVARMQPWKFDASTDWRQMMRDVCGAYRNVITAHPEVFAAGRPMLSAEHQPAFRQIVDLLQDAGFPPDVALDLFHVGSAFARGLAGSETAAALDSMPDGWNPDRAFSRGLEAILDGFESLRG